MINFIKNLLLRRKIKKTLDKLGSLLHSRYGKGPYSDKQIRKTFEDSKLDQRVLNFAFAYYLNESEFSILDLDVNYQTMCQEVRDFGICDFTPTNGKSIVQNLNGGQFDDSFGFDGGDFDGSGYDGGGFDGGDL